MSGHAHRTTLVIGESAAESSRSHIYTDHVYLAGNIHCPSCVSKIESIFAGYHAPDDKHRSRARSSLNRIAGSLTPRSRSSSPSSSTLVEEERENKLFTPAFTRVDVSPINGTVSFDHSPDVSFRLLITELEDAGFDVVKTDATTDLERKSPHHGRSPIADKSRWSRFADLFTLTKDKQKAHRDNCEACREEEEARIQRSRQRWRARSPAEHSTLDPRPQDEQSRGHGEPVENAKPLMRGIFSIDGMTCT